MRKSANVGKKAKARFGKQAKKRKFWETDDYRQRRIAFAEGYSSWGDIEWSRVLWSDHTLFPLEYQSREYVMRPPGHAS